MTRRLLPLLLLAAMAVLAPAAAAWTRFSPPAADSVAAHMGVARTADGKLHVLWIAHASTLHRALMHTSFTASGKLGASTTVSSNWATLEPAGLALGAGGLTLDAFWGGQSDAAHQELNWSESKTGGTTWGPVQGNLVSGEQVGMDAVTATRLGSQFFQTWSSYVHLGTGNPPAPANLLSASPTHSCCGYDAVIAANGVGKSLLAAWYSNQTAHDGVYVQAVNPLTGKPGGAVTRMPGTRDVSEADQQPALIARPGAKGFVVAYGAGAPSMSRFNVWVVGRAGSTTLGSSDNEVLAFTLAPAGAGRVWAAFLADKNDHLQIVVRRSNAHLTSWGAPVVLKPPAPGKDVWNLSSSSIGGALDLLAAAGDQGRIAEYQTRVFPGLTLDAKPSRLARKGKTKVTFTVTDAGSPVAGALVKVAGKSAKTGKNGTVKLKLGPFGRHVHSITASVSAKGYTAATIKLKVG